MIAQPYKGIILCNAQERIRKTSFWTDKERVARLWKEQSYKNVHLLEETCMHDKYLITVVICQGESGKNSDGEHGGKKKIHAQTHTYYINYLKGMPI